MANLIKDEVIKEQDFVYAPNYLNEYIYILLWLQRHFNVAPQLGTK